MLLPHVLGVVPLLEILEKCLELFFDFFYKLLLWWVDDYWSIKK